MKKYCLYFSLLGSFISAQNTYIDVVTTGALKLYSDNLKKKQNETIEQQNKLQKAQTWVATQMAVANNIQNKILTGLNEVSGTLTNGLQVKEIYEDLKDCSMYSAEISRLVKEHPEYAVFGAKTSEVTYKQILKMSTEVQELLKSGDLNLATAGDRYKLLYDISSKVKMLKVWLATISLDLDRAKRLGFWRAINPFQGYINTDKDIVRNIMEKYKNNF
ncbi:hypothetical protein PG593_03575 [Riemerella anatipestifer]|uniref:hypothetical protein n=1 Tax=Riemerella anatipestifer TaxID=34085 RepID=UPI00069CACF0|nr:hypothetical protein [Riemerella anatipestifer]MDR7693400.1 hypothetical protein [Riemerella anatipestifer]MDY3528859.1 hypothetical protein [Riemerella anatipestifer]MDY3538074.1 hypothetical protein [Riemerella anatipestifer]